MKILIADDTLLERRNLSVILEERGHKVTTVHSGTEAIKIMKTEKFDLILMDIEIPAIENVESAEQLFPGFSASPPVNKQKPLSILDLDSLME
jgi:CheY-like chemotaxis protein